MPSRLNPATMVATTEQPKPVEKNGKKRRSSAITPRQSRFAELVVAGLTLTDAYRKAYKKEKLLGVDAGEYGWRVAQSERVKARIAELRGETQAQLTLSLSDRLRLLAEFAQDKTVAKGDRIAALAQYAKQAGDLAPQKIELSGPGGGSIAVSNRVMSPREVMEDLRRARAAAKLAEYALAS